MRLLPAVSALLLVACSSHQQPKTAESPERSAPEQSNTVIMSAEAQRNAAIELVTLEPAATERTIRAAGQIQVNEERTWGVGAHVEGRIVEVFAAPGDRVRRGATLAHIHGHDVHDSRADYQQAQSEAQRAQAAAALARRQRDRAVRLLEMKAGSRVEVESAEAAVREADAAVRQAETQVERVRVHLTEYLNVPVREPGAKTTSHDDEVPVRAPESGMVVERKVSSGVVVSAGQELFRITDPTSLWLIANVAETDLGDLRVGQPAEISVRAYPDRTFSGRILRLGEALDPQTRTLQVRILVPDPSGMLKPEMFATVTLRTPRTRQALSVPDAALQDHDGRKVVFVRTAADKFSARVVTPGERTSSGTVEILEGLNAGDVVVGKGSFIVKSHMLRSALEEED